MMKKIKIIQSLLLLFILGLFISLPYARAEEIIDYVVDDKIGDFNVGVDRGRMLKASWKNINLLLQWGEIWSLKKIQNWVNPKDVSVYAFSNDIMVKKETGKGYIKYRWGQNISKESFRQVNEAVITPEKISMDILLEFKKGNPEILFNPILFPGFCPLYRKTGAEERRIKGVECEVIDSSGKEYTKIYPSEGTDIDWLPDNTRTIVFPLVIKTDSDSAGISPANRVRYSFSSLDPEAKISFKAYSKYFYGHPSYPKAIVSYLKIPAHKEYYKTIVHMEIAVGEAADETPEFPGKIDFDGEVDISIKSKAFYNVFSLEEPREFEIKLDNKLNDKDRNLSLVYELRNYENDVVDTGTINAKVGKNQEQTVLVIPKDKGVGIYGFKVITKEGDKEVGRRQIRYGVVPKPAELSNPEKAFFGVCLRADLYSNKEDTLKLINFLKRIGIRTGRMGTHGTDWSSIEPSPGKYKFSPWLDEVVDLYINNGMFIWFNGFALQGVWSSQIPKWAEGTEKYESEVLKVAPKDMSLYENYIYQVVNHFKGRIKYYEMWNEPQDVEPEIYVKFLKAFNSGVKRADPDALVLGAAAYSIDAKQIDWIKKVVENEKGYECLNLVPFHHYYSSEMWKHNAVNPIFLAPEKNGWVEQMRELKNVLEKYKIRYWMGEVSWANTFECMFPKEKFEGFEKDLTGGVMRAYILAMAENVEHIDDCFGVETFHIGSPPKDSYAQLVSRACSFFDLTENIQARTIAHANLASLLDGSRFVTRIDFKSDRAWCMVFKREDITTSAIWMIDDKGALDVTLPEGTKYINIVGSGRDISGKQKIKISEEPIYLSVKTADGDKLINSLKEGRFVPEKIIEIGKIKFTDDKKGLQVSIKNISWEPVEIKEITLSYGDTELKQEKIALTANGDALLKFIPAKELDNSFTALVCANILGKTYTKKEYVFYPSLRSAKSTGCLIAMETTNPVKIDGDLSEWDKAVPIILNKENKVLYNEQKIVESNRWKGVDDLSATGYVMWDNDNIYFACKVKDDVYANSYPDGMMSTWNCDSIQMAFDPLMDNQSFEQYNKDDQEINISLSQKGPVYWRRTFGDKENQYPDKITILPDGQIPGAKLAVKKEDKGMTYEFMMPVKELYPLEVKPGNLTRFNFIVNDDDGGGRRQWIGITPGIGDKKAPYLYKKLYFSEISPIDSK